MKVLIIGLDGATWDVFDDYLLENYMPNLNRLKKGGYWGVLRSTDPPITPAAWTTCITGCNPQTHKVVGFHDYSYADDFPRISSANTCAVPNIFQKLSEQGYKVASINVPWTYPCVKVNGIMVAGYGMPGLEVEFTYPADFKKELLEKIPDYAVMAQWEKSDKYDVSKIDQYSNRVEASFKQRVEAARLINGKSNLDFMMVQFHDIDAMQHHIWQYMGKATRDKYPMQRDRIFKAMAKLDEQLGALLKLADTGHLSVAVVSDHGFGGGSGNIYPNALLYKWGYLKRFNEVGLLVRKNILRWKKKLSGFIAAKGKLQPLKSQLPVQYGWDWSRSKAILMHGVMNGHIYLNVKGRQPHGTIEQGKEYDRVILDLRRRFESVLIPNTSERLFEKVVTPAELYGNGVENPEKFGDLILVPKYSFILRPHRSGKAGYVEMGLQDCPEGSHRPDGIYIFYGPDIKAGKGGERSIADVAPTVYAAMEAALPSYMDGAVIEEIFTRKPSVRYEQKQSDLKSGNVLLSSDEEAKIAKSLADLGYID